MFKTPPFPQQYLRLPLDYTEACLEEKDAMLRLTMTASGGNTTGFHEIR
jgi:hypothetical protein